MRKLILFCLLLAGTLLFADVIYVVNSQSRTLSKVDLTAGTVNNSFAALGNVPNRVIVDENTLWVVNSGDNSLQKILRETGQSLANYFVALNSNPWDALIDDNYIYVTGLVDYKLYKMDKISGQILGSILLGPAPEALAIHAGKLYITNAGDYMQNYSGSSLAIIDLGTFMLQAEIPLPANPQYITVYGDDLHISCTGNWLEVPGSIVVFDTVTEEIAQNIPIGGAPGNIWISPEAKAYVADASGMSLYLYDAETFEILNSGDNPLPYPASYVSGTASHIALLNPNWGNNGILQWMTADFEPVASYTLGLMPSDMALWTDSTGNQDAVYPAFQKLISLYPNPLGPAETLRIKSESGGELVLYNLRGQKLYQKKLAGAGETELDLQLPSGIYLYRYQNDKDSQSGKLLLK